MKKFILIIVIIILSLLFLTTIFAAPLKEEGLFSVYFMDEKVGYEEYVWQLKDNHYILSVRGKMTKPVEVEFEKLEIKLNLSFIPLSYEFKGRVSGVKQEIFSSLSQGLAVNIVRVSGIEQTMTENIKRDTFLLPNPMFSPYLILTKKFQCSLEGPVEISTYVIPQMEVLATVEPQEDNPCSLFIKTGEMEIHLESSQEGYLQRLLLPSKNLEVVREK